MPIGLSDITEPESVRRRRRACSAGAGALSLAAHAALLLAMMASFAAPPLRLAPPDPVAVDVVGPPKLAGPVAAPTPSPPHAASPAPPKPTPPAVVARPSPAPRQTASLDASDSPALSSFPSLSDAELAGAAAAGSGSGGGECDMAARVQSALRKDALARAAVARLPVKAVKIWDGDWVWLPGDDGKGLAAVRQAMMWEIAFAPSECRTRPMHGLVVLSPGDGAPRLAVGATRWKWADLLKPHDSDANLANAEP